MGVLLPLLPLSLCRCLCDATPPSASAAAAATWVWLAVSSHRKRRTQNSHPSVQVRVSKLPRFVHVLTQGRGLVTRMLHCTQTLGLFPSSCPLPPLLVFPSSRFLSRSYILRTAWPSPPVMPDSNLDTKAWPAENCNPSSWSQQNIFYFVLDAVVHAVLRVSVLIISSTAQKKPSTVPCLLVHKTALFHVKKPKPRAFSVALY